MDYIFCLLHGVQLNVSVKLSSLLVILTLKWFAWFVVNDLYHFSYKYYKNLNTITNTWLYYLCCVR